MIWLLDAPGGPFQAEILDRFWMLLDKNITVWQDARREISLPWTFQTWHVQHFCFTYFQLSLDLNQLMISKHSRIILFLVHNRRYKLAAGSPPVNKQKHIYQIATKDSSLKLVFHWLKFRLPQCFIKYLLSHEEKFIQASYLSLLPL